MIESDIFPSQQRHIVKYCYWKLIVMHYFCSGHSVQSSLRSKYKMLATSEDTDFTVALIMQT